MSDMNLTELETTQYDAYQNYWEASDAVTAAEAQTAAAESAFGEAGYLYRMGEISQEECEAALQAWEDAQAEEQAAKEALEAAAGAAQAATEAVEEKKAELRESRDADTTYVVHRARIECTYGMRESYLTLESTHGVLTRQIPQMTADDIIPDTNIINFGGCHSIENPDTKAVAEEAVRAAKAEIEKNQSRFVDWIIGLFVDEQEIEVTESLTKQCVGKCLANFPADAEWIKGHGKVFINGKPVLLRRCSLMCNYGGCITVLVSGQPE